jgi:hypothetical protein
MSEKDDDVIVIVSDDDEPAKNAQNRGAGYARTDPDGKQRNAQRNDRKRRVNSHYSYLPKLPCPI